LCYFKKVDVDKYAKNYENLETESESSSDNNVSGNGDNNSLGDDRTPIAGGIAVGTKKYI
jgi:hypothetical protein